MVVKRQYPVQSAAKKLEKQNDQIKKYKFATFNTDVVEQIRKKEKIVGGKNIPQKNIAKKPCLRKRNQTIMQCCCTDTLQSYKLTAF